MDIPFIADKEFNRINFNVNGITRGEYDNCIFNNCNFSQLDLGQLNFAECEFNDCDFSNALINNTSFREVTFNTCKMLGLKFEHANKFLLSFSFNNCILNFSSFYQLSIKNSSFKNCTMHEVDFTETELINANFSKSDLKGAIFDQTKLDKSDFRTALNFSIHPGQNSVAKAKFSHDNISGLLDQFNISIE